MKHGHGQVCSRGLLEAQQGEIWPMGLLLSIFSLKGRDRVLDLWWAFALIWIPLIVVPDSSP
jgi:hypothetical protein